MTEAKSVILDRKLFQKVAQTLGPQGDGVLNGEAKSLLDEISKLGTSESEFAKNDDSTRRLIRRSVKRALELDTPPSDRAAMKILKMLAADINGGLSCGIARGRVRRFAQYIASTPPQHLARR